VPDDSSLLHVAKPLSRAATAVLVRNRNQDLLGKVVIVLNGTCDDVRLLQPAEWRSCTSTPPTGLSWRLGASQQLLTQSAVGSRI